MPLYHFEATNRQGETVTEELAAENVMAAIEAIEARELVVVSIRRASDEIDGSKVGGSSNQTLAESAAHGQKVRPDFYRHIDAALAKRETTIMALEALCADSTPRAVARDIQKLIDELSRGPSTEEFLASGSAAWLPFILRSAHHSTTPFDPIFGAVGQEIDARIVRRKALLYPLIVAFICVGVLAILSATVVPTFKRMFYEFGLRLPMPTQVLISISDLFVQHTFWLVLNTCFLGIVGYVIWRAWNHFSIGSRCFGIFTAGSTSNVNSMARFAGTLAEMLNIDAPLADALRLAGRSCQHSIYDKLSQQLALDVSDNNKPPFQSEVAHLFPALLLHALHAGPGRKPSIPLLRQISILYDEGAKRRWNWTQGAIGPLAVFMLGIIIGFIVIALFMPLISLITALS